MDFYEHKLSSAIKIEPGHSSQVDVSNLKCLVCDEDEAGRHYGSICCSGCKGFFRRTVRFNKTYSCSYQNNCIIRKEYRNCCRACRYQKCLERGLNPMLVHGDRGTSKHGHPPHELEHMSDITTSSRNSLVLKTSNRHRTSPARVRTSNGEIFHVDMSPIEGFIIASKFLHRDENLPLGTLKIIPFFDPNDYASVSKYYMLVERLCDTYVDTELSHMSQDFEGKCSVDVSQAVAIREPRRICLRTNIEWEPKFYITSTLFRRIWCRIAEQYFDWASHIPELQDFDERDQESLLIGRCIPSVWLQIGRKSAITRTNGIALSGGSYFPADRSEWDNVDKDVVMILGHPTEVLVNEFIRPMQEIQVTEAEYTLLRVICFFIPAPRMSSLGIHRVNAIKSKYVDVLTELIHTASSHLPITDILQRISRIMLLLPVLEKVAQMEDDTMSLMTLFNIAEMRGTLPYDIHVRKNDPFSINSQMLM